MSQVEGLPPVPPAAPPAYVPPAYPPPYTPPAAASPAYPPPYVPRAYPSAPSNRPRRKAWPWVLGGIGLIVVMLAGCGILGSLMGTSGGFSTGKKVAVISFSGAIAGTSSMSGGEVTPERFLALLDRAESDPAVKAIVLRIDSPGGTVAASEEIALYVKSARKPVVVSVGDVAASGAYMVASQADKIIALPGSAVGSIGVITEIPNVSNLLDKVGVQFKVITAGKYKDAGSPYRALTPEETALIQGQVDEAYLQFIDIVAEGRHMRRGDVEKLATGWAWSGAEAQTLGLVDSLGTYRDALDSAAELGGIKGTYEVESYSSSQGSLLGALLGIERQLSNLSAVVSANTLSTNGGAVLK